MIELALAIAIKIYSIKVDYIKKEEECIALLWDESLQEYIAYDYCDGVTLDDTEGDYEFEDYKDNDQNPQCHDPDHTKS